MLENFLRNRKMQKLREGFTPAVLQERLRGMEEYLGTDQAVLQLGAPDEIFARGMDHHNNKRYNEAVPFFDETRKMRGDDEDFRMLGKCWCISENEGREAKMKAAQTSIVAFMSIKGVLKAEDNYYLGSNFIHIAEMAEGKSRADNYREAVSYLEKAVEKEGNNWIYHNSLGDAYECIADDEEDLAKKVDFYEKAVNQFNESTSLAGLGVDFDRIEKKLARAKEEYRKQEEEVEAALKEEERKKAGQEKAAEARLDDFFGRSEKTQTSTGIEAIKQGWDEVAPLLSSPDAPGFAYEKGLEIKDYTRQDILTFCLKSEEFYEDAGENPYFLFFADYVLGLVDNVAHVGEEFFVSLEALRNLEVMPNKQNKSKKNVKLKITGFETLGDCKLTRRIEDSSLCYVYMATDKEGEQRIAKLLKPKWKNHVAGSFLEAARKLKEFRGKYTVRYSDYGKDREGNPYLVMEFPGKSYVALDSLKMPLQLPEAVNITQQLASALAYAHKKEVYHGYMRPGDVFYDAKTGDVKLADSGLNNVLMECFDREEFSMGSLNPSVGRLASARTWREEFSMELRDPLVEFSMGLRNPVVDRFASARNSVPKKGGEFESDYGGPKTDVYSLGKFFYKLLTGELACVPINLDLIKEKNPNAPEKLVDLVEEMLSRDIEKRPFPDAVARNLKSIAKQVA